MDYTDEFYFAQQAPLSHQSNGSTFDGAQQGFPSTSSVFYGEQSQASQSHLLNKTINEFTYSDAHLIPSIDQYSGGSCGDDNNIEMAYSHSSNAVRSYLNRNGMMSSPAASCESSLYSGGVGGGGCGGGNSSSRGAATSPRMPIGMSAQSPGVYSPFSDSASPLSANADVLHTASFNMPAAATHNASKISNDYGEVNMKPNESVDSNPGSLISDPVFIQRHNFSVEVYQNFKESVDQLFLANTQIQDKSRLIPAILETVNVSLVTAMEAEKDYLINQVLSSWAIQQQKYSIAPLWTQQMHYNQLNSIDAQFEYFGELLEQTLSGLQYLVEHFPKVGFEEAFDRVRQIAHLFLFYSVVVARQPPAVVVKCGEAENHRRSRFWFNTELRILGGRAFGLQKIADNLQVKCYLITDETAKKLRNNAYYNVNENEHFVIEPSVAAFHTFTGDATTFDAGEAFAAKFDDMRVSKKEQLRREEVWKKRYNLCYNIRIIINTKYRIELVGKKVSLPFAILVGPKCDVEAKLFLERSFADFIRQPDLELPASVHCADMVAALEMRFQAILETPQKSTDQPIAQIPKPFLNQSRRHLANRLKPDADSRVLLENFLKMPVAEEYCIKRGVNNTSSNALLMTQTSSSNSAAAADSGEWKLVPFFEWFFKLAELVNKNFVQLWNNGLIFGFCGKDEAELLLAECQRPTLLIRFSDYEFAKIKISVRDRTGAIRHHWYETQDLVGRSLREELLHNVKYRDVEFVYPNISLEMALGARRDAYTTTAERARKPRNLQPSPIYFNNQEPAVRLNSF